MSMKTLMPRLRNSSINGPRFSPDINPDVKSHLAELNKILGKASFNISGSTQGSATVDFSVLDKEIESRNRSIESAQIDLDGMGKDVAKLKTELAKAEEAAAGKKNSDVVHKLNRLATMEDEVARSTNAVNVEKMEMERLLKMKNRSQTNGKFQGPETDDDKITELLQKELRRPLIPKKTTSAEWDSAGILDFLNEEEDDDAMSISDSIDKINKLANLKNSFQQNLQGRWNSLSENQKAVLNTEAYPNVMDYLLAYGYFVRGIGEVNAMFNFISTHKNGANAAVNYATISTARYMIQKNGLVIENDEQGNTYNDDVHPLIISLKSAAIPFHEDEFKTQVEKSFKSYIANGSQFRLIRKGLLQIGMSPEELAALPDSKLRLLNTELRKYPIKVTDLNIEKILPQFLYLLSDSSEDSGAEDETDLDTDQGDEMFEVEFEEDEPEAVVANTSNVRCAAQLFSSMIMDTELDMFNLMNYLTNNYLIRNRVDISDPALASDLQLFVFSNRFIVEDKKHVKHVFDRTDPSERGHFYRQVFNFGTEAMPQDVIANVRFPRLWGQLLPAVKRYLEESSASLSEDTFVSKGGVMQIVAGLKTNAAQFCTSMAKIISPIIDAEWHFIKDRILNHEEIIKRVSPMSPTWKGVAETLYAEMNQRSIDASLIHDKAHLTYMVLREVAEYEPRKFEEQNSFINFCSLVIELESLNTSIAEDYADYVPADGSDPATAAQNEAYANAGIPNMPGMNFPGMNYPGFSPAANANGNGSANGNGTANGNGKSNGAAMPKGWDF